MDLSSEVTEAYQEWLRIPRPFANFRAGDSEALTYGVELDLDHQESYLSTMLSQLALRNSEWDFAMRARYELDDLQHFRDRLAVLEVPETVNRPLREYMDATEKLLMAVLADAGAR